MTDEATRSMIIKFMDSQSGRVALAQAMVQPLRTRREYRFVNGRPVPTDAPFACDQCGTWSQDEKYCHSEAECAVAFVITS